MSERGLLDAIVAAPDDDTPRLVYADWLDDHGDVDRAEFIRVQCRLADRSPAEPDWVDLRERQAELAARLKKRLRELGPGTGGFYFGSDILRDHEEPFRRGFPYFIHDQTGAHEWTAEQVRHRRVVLQRLLDTTTVRGLKLYEVPTDRLFELFDSAPFSRLRGLSLSPHLDAAEPWEDARAVFYRRFAAHPALRGIRQLFLYGGIFGSEPAVLAKAKLEAIRQLTLAGVVTPPAEVMRLTRAAWFRRLLHIRIGFPDAGPAAGAAGLAQLPELHTLDLLAFRPDGLAQLAAGPCASLGRLMLQMPLDRAAAAALSAARFPRLAVFEGRCGMKLDALEELLRADWFARLRVLNLMDNAVGNKGVAAVAAHPVARTLRIFRVGESASGKSSLNAIARRGAFPELTTLDLRAYRKRRATEAHLVAFVSSLQLPRLRHLDLSGWPLGSAGAVALAANPALAGLTRLDLSRCEIGDEGAKDLLASPHLQNLVELHLSYNPITTGADALADPGQMPRLGECWLSCTQIPADSAERIKATDRYVII